MFFDIGLQTTTSVIIDLFAHKQKKQSTGSTKRLRGKHQTGLDRNAQKYKDKKRLQRDGDGKVKWKPSK